MEILQDYKINEKTVLFTGEFDKFGKLCTLVIEGEKKLLVNLTPEQVINNTLLEVGSNFRGALESSRKLLWDIKMYPLKINAELEIWIFPTKSFKDPYCVWFSLTHVQNKKAISAKKTEIHLSYQHTFEINMKKASFENKQQKARELREIIIKNTKTPFIMYFEPKKGFQISEDVGGNRYKIDSP